MQTTKATKRYAKALLEYAIDKGQALTIFQEMNFIKQVISENPELGQVLSSPIIKSGVKKNILEKIFSDMSDTTKRLIDVLVENKRIVLIGDIAQEYIIQYDAHNGKQVAEVTTAYPICEALQDDILQKVKQITGNENVSLQLKVDASIIGGFILRVGDLQYNASVANQFDTIRKNFQGRL